MKTMPESVKKWWDIAHARYSHLLTKKLCGDAGLNGEEKREFEMLTKVVEALSVDYLD